MATAFHCRRNYSTNSAAFTCTSGYAEVWDEVYAVHSHPHAIAQCHKFLNEELKGVTVRDMTSTSLCAQYVKRTS